MIARTNVMSGAGGTNVMYGADRTKFQMVSVQRSIWVKFEVIGFHCYPDAPEQVAYLRDRHRHKFGFTVSMPVTHNEREVEFHMLQSECRALHASGQLEADGKSCETLASELAELLSRKYKRAITVEVNEDGECGAVVTYTLVGG